MLKGISVIALALAVMVATFECDSTAEAQAVDKDLVFYLHFDEGSGTPKDASENPTQVSMEGNLKRAKGKFGSAMEFDGDPKRYLVAAHSDKLEGMEALTIMAWVNASAPDDKPRAIVSKREGGAKADVYNLFSYTGVKFCGRVDAWNHEQGNLQTFSTTLVQDQTWQHVTYIFDGAAKEAERQKMYIDGNLETTKSHPDEEILEGGSSLYIGILNAGYGQTWQGTVDEISIWSRALKEAEIQTLMQEPIPMSVQPVEKLPLTWGQIRGRTHM